MTTNLPTQESQNSDEALVQLVTAGDSAAFGVLVGRYEDRLHRYARKFFAGEEDRQDLVQEVFIKAYINLRSFDTTRRFSPWLYRIAHNEFVNGLKRQIRLPFALADLDVLLPQSSVEDAQSALERIETVALVHALLDRLDLRYREPLLLYYLEEMTYQEIADILRIPTATVGVRLRRGRLALQKLAS